MRERPVRLQPGLGAALHRCEREVRVLPLAIEYVFGEERYPEIMLAFGGEVTPAQGSGSSAGEWTRRCEAALERIQDRLAEAVIARGSGAFEEVLAGAAGVGGFYGCWQRLKAAFTGRSYEPRHGALKTDGH
ncbi:MAG: hypothetical protein GWO24_32385 [Akkermansiaceae bacterium]|nr:hypothetical protein [Akkermansiaceae bacterium]